MHAGLGRRLLEGIEVHDDHVDRQDTVLGNGSQMVGIFAPVQNAAVNLRMQRLDAPVEHLGEAGQFGDVFDGNAGFAKQFGRASGRNQFDAESDQFASEIDQPGFIGDAKNGALNFRHEGTSMRDETTINEERILAAGESLGNDGIGIQQRRASCRARAETKD